MNTQCMVRLLLVVALVMGTAYGVSARDVSGLPETGVDDVARLTKDIAVLRCINALELTDEQIAALLPALREVKKIVEREETEVRERLIKEKEALLRGEKTSVDSGEVLKNVALRAQRLKVAMEGLKLKMIEVLTPQQLVKVQRVMLARQSEGIQTAVPSGAMRRGLQNLNVPLVKLRQIDAEESHAIQPEVIWERTETSIDTEQGTDRLETMREVAMERLNRVSEADGSIQLQERTMQERDETVLRLQAAHVQRQRAGKVLKASARQGRFGFGMGQAKMRGAGQQIGHLQDLIRVLEEKLGASSSLSESR
jgi:hypothetical protein